MMGYKRANGVHGWTRPVFALAEPPAARGALKHGRPVLHDGREAILRTFVKKAAADAGGRIEAPRILRRKKGSEVW
ncbi:hypothetical protein ACFLQ0_02355 [Nitrospinota bacterium]